MIKMIVIFVTEAINGPYDYCSHATEYDFFLCFANRASQYNLSNEPT